MNASSEREMKAPRISPREVRLCREIGADPEAILAAVPEAIIVGEQPPVGGQPDAPLFPSPSGGAGGRLHRMSGFELQEYLERFQRVNLVREFHRQWPREMATAVAEALLRASAALRWPLVLCGAKVAEAFCVGDALEGEWRWLAGVDAAAPGQSWFHWSDQPIPGMMNQAKVCRIPHPSGRNLVLNDPAAREMIARVLREACPPDGRHGTVGAHATNPAT